MQQEPVRYARKVPLTVEERLSLQRPDRMTPEPRRSKAWLLVALIAIFSIVAASIWFFYLKPAGNSGPEDTVRDVIDAMNREDAEDFVSHTMISFETPGVVLGWISDMEQEWAESGNPEMTIVSMEVISRDQMSSEVEGMFEHYSGVFEVVDSITIEDFCGVHVEVTATSGGGEVLEMDLPLYKVGSVWYVDILFDPWATL